MVATKLIVELVIIIVTLAVGLFWLVTNYQSISTEFFDFLSDVTIFG